MVAAAHRDVVGGPRADPGEGEELVAVARVQPVGKSPGEGDEGPAAGARHRQLLRVELRKCGRLWEEVRDGAARLRQRLAEACGQAAGLRAGRRDADLLAEHGAEGDLGGVDGAGDAAPGRRLDELAEQRIGGERAVDGAGVGVEVQQVPAASCRLRLVARVARLEAPCQLVDVDRDHGRAAREPQAATVRRPFDLFHAGDRARREEAEQRAGVQRERGVELHAPIQRARPGECEAAAPRARPRAPAAPPKAGANQRFFTGA